MADEPLSAPQGETTPAEEEHLLAGKYKTPADLERAYEEANRALTQATQRASAAEESAQRVAEQLSEWQDQQQAWQAQQSYSFEADPWAAQYQRAYEEGDTRTMLAMQAQLAEAAAVRAAQTVASQSAPQQDQFNQMFAIQTEGLVAQRYGDEWDTLKGEVGQVLQANPHLMPDTTDPTVAANAVAFVADKIRSEKLAERSAQLDTQQRTAAQQKRQAQSAFGGNGPAVGNKTDRDALIERFKAIPTAGGLLS